MKVVILAGGAPSTISDEYEGVPKPMVEIGERPIIWHIMKMFSHYGLNNFVICTGYKGYMIKEYFRDYYIYQSDITVDLSSNHIEIHNKRTEDWRVTIVDTGIHASTGDRLLNAKQFIGTDDFFVSYGDCISNINVIDLLNYHIKNKKIATITVSHPTGRNAIIPIDKSGMLTGGDFGVINDDSAWVNSNTMVLKQEVIQYLSLFNSSLEIDFFNKLKGEDNIVAYKHSGFWSPMETLRDRFNLEKMWSSNHAPWKLWED